MRRIILLLLTTLLLAATALAAGSALLPKNFSGWQRIEHKTGANPTQADAANASLLKEYGFTDYESATYTRSMRKLHLKAARFSNATGSFGAFSLYRQLGMESEKIGDAAVVSGDHVLFYRANILVDAVFEKASVMSASELRSLADALPIVSGGAAGLPAPVQYLPTQSYVEGSSKYVVGPLGLAQIDSPLSSDAIDFERGAEVASGDYRTGSGVARLTVLSYPTFQIAAARMKTLTDRFATPSDPGLAERARSQAKQARKSGLQGTVTLPVSANSNVTFRRTGPMIVFISGLISQNEATSLAQSVNYDAEVRWTERAPVTMTAIERLIVGIFVLIFILVGVCLVLGFFFGGVPLLLQRFFPNHKFAQPQQAEIIKLNLNE